jgi:uncharacterized protein
MLGITLGMLPGRMGVAEECLSGFEKFESPDPAEWTARGYALIHIDSRGSWDSEGYLWYDRRSCVLAHDRLTGSL